MTQRRSRPLAALAVVALIGAGCGSDTPSGDGAATSSGSAPKKQLTARDKALNFADCVRANGVGDFPDPNAKGEFIYGVSVSPALFEKAVDACKELQPPGALSSKRTPRQQSASLTFAQCMRKNGVKDFPDPVNGEPLVDTTRIPSTNRPNGMAILDAAMQKCRRLAGATAGGQG